MDLTELSSSIRTSVSGLHKVLRKQMSGVSEYSMTEIETLAHLARNASLLPTELAALTKVKTQSMSQILKKLEGHGIISRTPSKEDMRKVYISLSPAGRKMIEQTRNEKDEWLSAALTNLTEKERELLVKALPIMDKLIETK
jgi:DNA-binding MarR family transcriptional regulator